MMKRRASVIILLLTLMWCASAVAQDANINEGWLFNLGDIVGASDPEFDDSEWRTLDLPHDWAFENGYSADGAQRENGGYTCGGVGWYRKHLNIDLQKRTLYFLDFDAVYMNSEVWLNGHYLGKRPYGYISFSYEATQWLVEGQNVISVRVDNSLEPSARWYHPCGIYGNVGLRTEHPVHFVDHSLFVRTDRLTAESATLLISYEAVGLSKNKIAVNIRLGEKSIVSQVQPAGNSGVLSVAIDSPELWSPDSPTLYHIDVSLLDRRGRECDTENLRFGIRDIGWTAEKGFSLNGVQTKLNGVCEHLEGGPVGGAWSRELMEWKLKLLREMGCNAIRTAHNPQLPMFYDLCDSLGIMVMDEAFDGWKRKAPHDYGEQAFAEWWERDLRAMIRRDRNHPCVVAYSVGNETKGSVASDLVRVCHEEDPTRAVTSGHSGSEFMDLFGVNGHSERKAFLTKYTPGDKAFVGTETPHTWQVRGFYRTLTWYRDGYDNKVQTPFEIPDLTPKEVFGYDWIEPGKRANPKQIYNSSYDNATVRITARQNLQYLRDCDWYSGSFRWTGFDYIGEAGFVHGGWPFRAFMGGVVDMAGFRKDHFYLYQSEWAKTDMVHLLPHWTHPTVEKGTLIPVWCYTTGDNVELFFNGRSLGVRQKGSQWNRMQCEWLVPWREGELITVAYRNGTEIARDSVRTAGAARNLDVSVETLKNRTGQQTVAVVTFSQNDYVGTMFPYADSRINIALPEGCRVLSFENGCPTDTECNAGALSRKAFYGLARAFVKLPENAANDMPLISGAILGDRSMKVSDSVTIDVRTTALTGVVPQKDISVRYTLDGGEPSLSSTLYNGIFKVVDGTVVKAAAYAGSELVLRMEERFGCGEGTFWGTPDNNLSTDTPVTFESDADGIAWYQENDGGEGRMTIRICYSAIRDVKLQLSNNLVSIADVTFRAADKEIELTVGLNQGANNFALGVADGLTIEKIYTVR